MMETFLHGCISSGVVSSEHEALSRRHVLFLQLLIVSSHYLCQEHSPGAVGVVNVAAVQ